MARPQGAWSLRATPLARLPVLERHAPSCLFASTPFGGPGGAQISASFAAIVCAASLAQRRTSLAPGPPSTSKVARAPPRPPAPTLGFPPPTSPPSLTPHPTLSPHSTVPRDSHLSGPATHPSLAARVPTPVPPTPTSWVRNLGPPSLTPLIHRISYAPCPRPHIVPTGLAAPVPSVISACSPPAPPSPSRLAPSLHDHFSVSLSFWTHTPPVLHALGLVPLPIHTRESLSGCPQHTTGSGLLIPPSQGYCPLSQGFACNSKAPLPPLSPSHCSKPAHFRLQGPGPSF